MTDDSIFLIDTNMLVYAHDQADKNKHEISKSIIKERLLEGTIAISSQNLSEFFSVVTRKKILEKQDAIKVISDIIEVSSWAKIDFTHKTVLEAAKISEQYSMHYWDSLLAATMKQNSILNLYTENARDFKIPWLNVVNPFEV